MAKTINKLDVRNFALQTIYLELLRYLIINPDKMQAVQIQYDVTLSISNPKIQSSTMQRRWEEEYEGHLSPWIVIVMLHKPYSGM